ncbi:hypothetical protein KUCAC02_024709, partial [Chaenocephalus aceratus]
MLLAGGKTCIPPLTPFFAVFSSNTIPEYVSDRKITTDEEEARRIAEMGKPVLGENSKLEVIIEESYEFKSRWTSCQEDNLALVWNQLLEGQFMEAIHRQCSHSVLSPAEIFNPEMRRRDESGEERLPSCFDYVMHFLTSSGRWACFIISIAIIGMLTAVIGDLASHFGCTIGLKDSVTAVVFVALGTSVPDTFASKVSAVQDTYADASIGNVTGSNAVNVFLGIGLAWSVAAIYWHMKGKPFVVEAGSLAFSVTLFTQSSPSWPSRCCFTGAAPTSEGNWVVRGVTDWATSAFLFGLWFLYILFSSLEAYCHIEGF